MIHHIKLIKEHEECKVKVPKEVLLKLSNLGYKKKSASDTLQAFLDVAFKGIK